MCSAERSVNESQTDLVSRVRPLQAVANAGARQCEIRVRVSLLAGQEASRLSLEGDDDDGQFEVSLLLQLSQNARPEEHLTLTDPIQVGVQVQVLYLQQKQLPQLSFLFNI